MQQASGKLRFILVVDALFQLCFWGVPGLVASTTLAQLWEVELPANVNYVRLSGVFSIGWGLLLVLALRNPARNLDILRVAVVSHLLVAGTILAGMFGGGVMGYLSTPVQTSIFWWVTVILNLVLALAIFFWMPSAERLTDSNWSIAGGQKE
jgi:hypothetical protein